ncbi:MAG: hypothetical protein U0841_10350 [Chloroflexia bacterium]
MVDLTAKPFFLDAAAADWVRRTIAGMTLEEKIGQLFINLNVAFAPGYLDHILDTYHVGGMRYRGRTPRRCRRTSATRRRSRRFRC